MVFIVAGDEPAAAVDASLLGLRAGEWCFVESHRTLHGLQRATVCLGSAHGRHPLWPAISAQLDVIDDRGGVHYVPDQAGD